MLRFLWFIGLIVNSHAYAAPTTWSLYSCSQKCGLTENSYTSVNFASIDLQENLKALRSFCDGHKMKLQGEPQCIETKRDFALNESYQRCRESLPGFHACGVSVIGYNSSEKSHRFFQSTKTNSFDLAELDAMKKCRATLNSYNSTCVIYDYWLTHL